MDDLDSNARRALVYGAVAGLVCEIVPFTRFVFGYLGTLVHEFGHLATNWVFGYPSIPAFDFMHGGGVTVHQDRNAFVMFGVYALFGMAMYQYRRNRRALGVLAAAAGFHAVASFTRLHELLQLFMGHGTELIIAGVFIYRALSGEKVRVQAERPVYAFAGFFILFDNVRFAGGLLTSHERRVEYELAKGGGAWMDLSQIAADFVHTDLAPVAGFLLLLTIAVPFVTLYAFRKREAIGLGFARWLAA